MHAGRVRSFRGSVDRGRSQESETNDGRCRCNFAVEMNICAEVRTLPEDARATRSVSIGDLNFQWVSGRQVAGCSRDDGIADIHLPSMSGALPPCEDPWELTFPRERVLRVTPRRTWIQAQKPQSVGLLKRRCPNCWGMDLAPSPASIRESSSDLGPMAPVCSGATPTKQIVIYSIVEPARGCPQLNSCRAEQTTSGTPPLNTSSPLLVQSSPAGSPRVIPGGGGGVPPRWTQRTNRLPRSIEIPTTKTTTYPQSGDKLIALPQRASCVARAVLPWTGRVRRPRG